MDPGVQSGAGVCGKGAVPGIVPLVWLFNNLSNIRTYSYIHAYMHTYIHTYVRIYIHTSRQTIHMYVCMYACMYVCQYRCLYNSISCVCSCTYLCVYVYTHAETQREEHIYMSIPRRSTPSGRSPRRLSRDCRLQVHRPFGLRNTP